MIFLLLTILLNTYIFVLLKIFQKLKVDALQTIVVNYWTCVVTGSIFEGGLSISSESVHQPWFIWAVMLGGGFITVFNLMAYCTKTDGITATTVTNKLSLVIPVIVSLFGYHEKSSFLKIAGIILSFPAVYMTVRQPKEEGRNGNMSWLIVLFFLSGFLDTFVKYAERNYLTTPASQASFTSHLFAVAGTIGTLIVLVKLVTGKSKLAWKNLWLGICLGVPNYFSIYVFIRMLHSDFLPSSASIPANNIGTVVASTAAAILLFREKVTPMRIAGLILSVVSILLIAFS
ncbi:DMT family transporter [Taibaiella soli]|uniref:EamA/RhaT family transporter n=1 Tax=Taibaiella soli TaxID=1649169 RepID=A0A2W2BBH5_9BACT|nr:DMT family transporter [Taibaiella soli]PZF73549.1 EamA/RhaT family transporter [Taibaiella soli]